MICFSHESGCSLSSSVNWKKFWNIFDNFCNRTWIWKFSFQSMSSRLISTNVSRISFVGWKKATTNHASHQRALVLPVGKVVSEQFRVLETPNHKLDELDVTWVDERSTQGGALGTGSGVDRPIDSGLGRHKVEVGKKLRVLCVRHLRHQLWIHSSVWFAPSSDSVISCTSRSRPHSYAIWARIQTRLQSNIVHSDYNYPNCMYF